MQTAEPHYGPQQDTDRPSYTTVTTSATSLQIALAVVTTLLVVALSCLLKRKVKYCLGKQKKYFMFSSFGTMTMPMIAMNIEGEGPLSFC